MDDKKKADRERRREDPMDYNRAQPTELDCERAVNFLERESPDADHPQARRKLGLYTAAVFNHGFDSGVEKVRAENGYEEGYKAALAEMAGLIAEMKPHRNMKKRR